jgi:hypothetical protein
MAWHLKVANIDPMKDATDEAEFAGWEPFQIEFLGAGGWVVCLRYDDGIIAPGDKPAA